MKHLKSYSIFEWQHNVPLDQFNTAANRFDGNYEWFGAGQTGAPEIDKFIDDFNDSEDKIDDKEDTEETIKRKKRKREKNKKESELSKDHSSPDFLTTWKRFITPHEPGKAG